MSKTEADIKVDGEKMDYGNEPEIVAQAVPDNSAPVKTGETPIPAGHSRFYCNKCHTVGCVFWLDSHTIV